MADFLVTDERTGDTIDTRWRASKHGQDVARPAQLDPTAFEAGVHYNLNGKTDGIIPSGTALSKLESGLYGPFVGEGGEDGADNLAGFINDNTGVAMSAKPTCALLVHGLIKPAVLPIESQRNAVQAAVDAGSTTGSFVCVTD